MLCNALFVSCTHWSGQRYAWPNPGTCKRKISLLVRISMMSLSRESEQLEFEWTKTKMHEQLPKHLPYAYFIKDCLKVTIVDFVSMFSIPFQAICFPLFLKFQQPEPASASEILIALLGQTLVDSNANIEKNAVMPYCVFTEMVFETQCLRSDRCWLEMFYWAQGIGRPVFENSYFRLWLCPPDMESSLPFNKFLPYLLLNLCSRHCCNSWLVFTFLILILRIIRHSSFTAMRRAFTCRPFTWGTLTWDILHTRGKSQTIRTDAVLTNPASTLILNQGGYNLASAMAQTTCRL